MDRIDWSGLDAATVTDANRWVLFAVLAVCVIGLALLPWLGNVRRKWWRRRNRHRDML